MSIDEYLDKVCCEIKWKAARKLVHEEIRSHLLQRVEELTVGGEPADQAEEHAILHMGDAASIGMELNKVHRPRYDWILVAALVALLGLGLLYTITVGSKLHDSPWPLTTLAGIACCLALSLCDIRKLIGKKSVYLPLYFGSILLLAVRFVGSEYIGFSSDILDKFQIICPVIMVLSAGAWVKDIQSWKGIATYLAAALAGGVALAVMPPVMLFITLMICMWAMLWTVKVKRKSLILISAAILAIFVLCVYAFTAEPYWLRYVSNIFNDKDGSGYVLWHAKLMVQNLNLFGVGTITTDIVLNYVNYNEYALLNFMWNYGLIAGFAVVLLCGVLLWRIYSIVLSIKDTVGRSISLGLCTYVSMQMLWNVLMNFGILPMYSVSTFIPMFSQVWSQYMVLGSMLGILLGLYRKKDNYKTEQHSRAVPAGKSLSA